MSYSVGESVSGVVCGITDYGAFVSLDDGRNGMIHISKLSRDYVSDIHSVIKRGDKVVATVISDADGKVALSLIGEAAKPKKRPMDFEEMLSCFKTQSDEKLAKINARAKKKRR